MKRLLKIIIVLVFMFAFGLATNRFIASKQTKLIAVITKPQQSSVSVNLPGTIYLTQSNVLYALTNGQFAPLPLPSSGDWMQPAVDGSNLLVVNRGANSSDLYIITTSGKVLSQLTNDSAPTIASDIANNHWIFWPHLLDASNNIVASYDYPTNGYEVDFSIWQNPTASWNIPRSSSAADQWTTPAPYTGGDTTPQPLLNGGILFTHYELEDVGKNEIIFSVIGYQSNVPASSTYLTPPTSDCAQPNVNATNTEVAMICATNYNNQQSVNVVVAPLLNGGAQMGNMTTVVGNCLCAYPTWAPNGKSLIYLAPQGTKGSFFLWWQNNVLTTHPSAPVLVTPPTSNSQLNFDATSPPLWVSAPAS